MTDEILVLNSGSSSIKYGLYRVTSGVLEKIERGQIDRLGRQTTFSCQRNGETRQIDIEKAADHKTALQFLLNHLRDEFKDNETLVVGHRVVHGGTKFRNPVKVDQHVLGELEALNQLAPLHQPYNVIGIKTLMQLNDKLVQVVCFDTAFHADHGKPVNQLALPGHFYEEGLRRYGFHGLSYEHVTNSLHETDASLSHGKIIAAHLGNGASLCAIENGRSIDSSMGFSALDGLMMGTRCGAIDAGALLYLLQEKNMSPEALSDLLYNKSGLLGVSGISNDMRDLLDSERSAAKEAVSLYIYRIVTGIGSMAASLRGLDALVFTGGVGENAAAIRERVCKSLGWLGLQLDDKANMENQCCISASTSKVKVYIIASNEELMIAKHTLALIKP